MLIGAHVSPAGGLHKAIDRGVERHCQAIQIFNQSPRMWKPTTYSEEDVRRFDQARGESAIGAVLIHASYLVNCASEDPDIREKSLTSLTNSLRMGQRIGATAVVLHPGSAKSGDVDQAIARAGETIGEALADSDGCALHLENTAGAGGTLGRSISELARLIEAAQGDERLGICLDSCHLFASGYDIRTAAGISRVTGELAERLGLARLGSLHLNDSRMPLGSNRDRHADVGEGELGEDGCQAFLCEPALQGLPCVLETPGPDHNGPTAEEVDRVIALHHRGLAAA